MKLSRIGLLAVGLTLMLAAVACANGPTPNIDTTIGAKITPEIPSTSVDWAAQPSNPATGKGCTLSGGETVASGWSGEDTGDNYCNNCFCSNGVLGCTKMACGVFIPTSSPEPNTLVPTYAPSASKSPAVGREDHTNRRVGNKVGDISPDFSILLTTGETLYSSTIRSDRMPVFLFFFSPL